MEKGLENSTIDITGITASIHNEQISCRLMNINVAHKLYTVQLA